MPGLFERPTGMPAPRGPRFGVGVQGRSLLSFSPKQAAVVMQGAEERRMRAGADAAFEFSLAQAGLSEAEKQLARLYRSAPQIAQVMKENEAREAQQRFSREQQTERLEATEARATEALDVKSAMAAARKHEMDLAGIGLARETAGAVRDEMLPSRFAAGLPGAEEQRIVIPKGLGVSDVDTGVSRVPVLGARLPPKTVELLRRIDPDNPALRATNEADFQQRKGTQIREQQKQQQGAQKEQERQERVATARAWIGKDATPDETEQFNLLSSAPNADPAKIAVKIRMDRMATKKKAETKAETKTEKDASKLETLEDALHRANMAFSAAAAAKARGVKNKASAGEQAQLNARTDAAEARVRAIEARIAKRTAAEPASEPVAPVAPRLQKFGWRTDSSPQSMEHRSDELMAKAEAGTLTPEELEELDALNDFLEAGPGSGGTK